MLTQLFLKSEMRTNDIKYDKCGGTFDTKNLELTIIMENK